ncbi:hypothetical protein SAMN04489806_2187 [Paramicrobacterium humi]|uniref:Uncharacterized protein n=1 Tax=Paramicrobacterium humi TaxID=640635 RepID=A0A1H4NGH0_9MICO|nr:hypothetical protein [Microbacterium humi]SEB94276.1 hypothetical protein SAMN04489806_2187 [Microbacterium humi]
MLRHSLAERVALAELPADVITEKGVVTEPVDLILGLSAATSIVARAHRLSNADDRASTRADEIDARVDSTALCA